MVCQLISAAKNSKVMGSLLQNSFASKDSKTGPIIINTLGAPVNFKYLKSKHNTDFTCDQNTETCYNL